MRVTTDHWTDFRPWLCQLVGHASQRDNVVGHASQRDSSRSRFPALRLFWNTEDTEGTEQCWWNKSLLNWIIHDNYKNQLNVFDFKHELFKN